MALDRKAAETYVRKFWFTPCDDGMLYSYLKGTVHVEAERKKLQKQGKLPGSDWKAVILPAVEGGKVVAGKERGCFIRPNPGGTRILGGRVPPELDGTFDIVPYYEIAGEHDGLVDCAHYVSRVLTAGGVTINHPGVPGLVQTLRLRPDTRTLGLEVPLAAGNRIMNSGVMKFGDVIAYYHIDPKTNKRGYTHSAVYTGRDSQDNTTHRISCHTIARFDGFFDGASWNIADTPDWRFTLIHFSDELFPPIPDPLRLEVTRAGQSQVYDFRANGKVVRARGTSGTAKSFGTRTEDHGYWFVQAFQLFVFWPRTGEVAKLSLGNLTEGRFTTMTVDDERVAFTVL